MKNYIAAIVFFFLLSTAAAQGPVTWRWDVKKIDAKTREIHLTAFIQQGWHIYAQKQPADAIALPTRIEFSKNPVLVYTGGIKEIGTLEKQKDPLLGVEAWSYTGQVNFVQRLTLKPGAKTRLGGSITFQACTGEKCLVPETVSFNIGLL